MSIIIKIERKTLHSIITTDTKKDRDADDELRLLRYNSTIFFLYNILISIYKDHALTTYLNDLF